MGDDNEVYTVEYLDGDREKLEYVSRPGKLVISYTNGDKFEGSYTKGEKGLSRCGSGKYTFSSGAVFEGNYSDGVKSGLGTYTYPNGDVFKGIWENNEKHGEGTYSFANGDKFSGTYVHDKKHGHGVYVYANGGQLVGEWENGKYVKGLWAATGGANFHGNFKNGVPDGKGTFYFENGLEQNGKFEQQGEDDEDNEESQTNTKFHGSDLKDSISSYVDVGQPALSEKEKHVSVRNPPKKPLGIIISGAPASGKGTQCEMIREEFNVVHLSTGDMLRAAVAAGSELGMKAKELMEAGKLVPDDVVIGAVKERLDQPDVKENGFLLDGFPRTAAQAQALSDEGIAVDVFLMLNVPDEMLVERVVGRRIDPETGNSYHVKFNPPPEDIAERVIQRADDTEEKVKVRLEGFHGNIAAIKDFYTDITTEIDGAQAKEEVWENVKRALSTTK